MKNRLLVYAFAVSSLMFGLQQGQEVESNQRMILNLIERCMNPSALEALEKYKQCRQIPNLESRIKSYEHLMEQVHKDIRTDIKNLAVMSGVLGGCFLLASRLDELKYKDVTMQVAGRLIVVPILVAVNILGNAAILAHCQSTVGNLNPTK